MKKLLLAIALALAPFAAFGQTATPTAVVVTTCGNPSPFAAWLAGRSAPLSIDTNGNQCITGAITGTFSATLGGFAPNGSYAPLAVTTSSARVALPTGAVVVVQNVGANAAFVNLGDGTVTATTAQIQVPASSWIALTVGANVDLAAITSSSTTTLTLVGGAGLATGAGGGSGGGGGAVTNAGTFATQPAGSVANDGAAAAINPVLTGCYASAGAPADVSADNDAVRQWCLRNGSTVVTPSYSGNLASTGNGVAGGATQRVTVASDNTPFPVKIDQTTPGTTNAVSVAQIGATTVATGSGVMGAGTQRIALATDSPGVIAFGQTTKSASVPVTVASDQGGIFSAAGATASAVPANGVYLGNNVAGNLTGQIGCGSSAIYDASTSGSTQLVAISGSTSIYVCGYSIIAGGTVNVKLTYGTGSACATGNAAITPAYQLTAQAGLVDGSPIFRGLKTIASQALCINASGAVAVQAIVYYTQF